MQGYDRRWRRLLVHGLVGGARRIYIAIDDDVHQRRQAGVARFLERRPDLLGLRYADAETAHRFRQPIESHVADNVADVAAARVFPLLPKANLVPGGVVADHADVGQLPMHHGNEIKAGESKRAIAVERHYVALRLRQFGRHGKTRTDAERTERT